jgi:hypothetical protein
MPFSFNTDHPAAETPPRHFPADKEAVASARAFRRWYGPRTDQAAPNRRSNTRQPFFHPRATTRPGEFL